MATPADNDVLKIRYICGDGVQLGENTVFYLVFSHTLAGATEQEIADGLSTVMGPLYVATLANTARYRGAGLQNTKLPLAVEVFSGVGNNPGSAGAIGLPKQTAGFVGLKTGKAGRGFRGRIYVPFPAAADNEDPGQPTNAYVTRLTNLANAIFLSPRTITGGGGTTTIIPVIWHRKTRTFDAINLTIPKKLWGTQRRRGDFGRINTFPI